MAEIKLKVTMLSYTPKPENVVAIGAKLCYSKAKIDKIQAQIDKTDQRQFIKKLIAMGHESVLEHVAFTFGIEGISRVCLAQLTRHRLASYSVQSQRYVSYKEGFDYIIPPNIELLGEEAISLYKEQMSTIQGWYEDWQAKLGKGEKSNEDARFVLPGACNTNLVMTMNARQLRHFFSLRMCRRAQWEIRELAKQIHILCLEIAPSLFEDAGAGCLRGPCPEGDKTCGDIVEVRKERKQLLEKMGIISQKRG